MISAMGSGQKVHSYQAKIEWTGNTGQGTSDYRAYQRTHEIAAEGKPVIPGSSDPAFRGDKARYNPEELLVASLSACHMLWYLHLCADKQIIVTSYTDCAEGKMIETEEGGGRFTEVTLKPEVTVKAGADLDLAKALHQQAHHLCFIANSVNFPVRCESTIRTR
jgi:organic hydroperoxide reductase OsmC/OhrA